MADTPLTLFDAPAREAVLHFDGGSRGNPGPAAWGFTLTAPDASVLAAEGRVIGVATNNEAEYGGLLAGLRHARELGITHLSVRGDSKLVVEQMAGNWRVKAPGLQALHRAARDVASGFASIDFAHVRRAGNSAADRLVNAALDSADGSASGVSTDG